jgi:hypothetical protein
MLSNACSACSGCLHIYSYLCIPIFSSSLLFLPVIPIWSWAQLCIWYRFIQFVVRFEKKNDLVRQTVLWKELTTPLSTPCVYTVHNFCFYGFGLWYVFLTCAFRHSHSFTPLPCFRVLTYEKTIKYVTVRALWHVIVLEFHIMNVNFSCRLKTACELQGQGWTGIKISP